MRPDQVEDNRYKEDDHCRIELEEEIMFKMLEEYSKKIKKEKKEIRVLDIGCGSGLITKEIKRLGYSVKGLDFSSEAVNKASQNGIDAKVCNLDEGIIEEDSQFDVVWAGDIIEHVFDPMGLLKEMNRVLKKGGVTIISIPNDVGLNNRLRMLFGISYQEQMYRRSGYYKHHTFFTPKLMDYMLRKANLSRKKTQKILILPHRRLLVNYLPKSLYNQLIITAEKR